MPQIAPALVRYNDDGTPAALLGRDAAQTPLPLVSRAGISGCVKPWGAAGSAATAGYTVTTQIPGEAVPYAAQAIYMNWGASTWAVTAAKIAPCPTHLNDGSALTPVTITFTDAGTTTVPVALGGTGNDIIPGMLVSDVIPLSGVVRSDTPANAPLVHHRVYSADAQMGISGPDFASYNAVSGGRQWAGKVTAADQVTAWPAQAVVEAAAGWVQPAILRLFYSTPSVTVASCGDSLDRGQGSTANAMGWLQRACALLTSSSRIVQPLVMGWSGQTHTASAKIAKQVIAKVKPNFLIINAWSPNDTAATQAIMDRAWAETLDVIEYGRQNGVGVIVRTSGPVNAYSAADDARIKAQNARVRSLGAAVAAILDHASILEAPGTPGQILAAYNLDGTHYNDAGYSALATYDAGVLRSVVGA